MSVQVYRCQRSLEGTVWSSISDITNSSFVSSLFIHIFITCLSQCWQWNMNLHVSISSHFSMPVFYMNEEMQSSRMVWLSPGCCPTLSALPCTLMSSHDFKSHSNTANWRTPTSSTDLVSSYRQTHNYCLHSDASTSQARCGKEECPFFHAQGAVNCFKAVVWPTIIPHLPVPMTPTILTTAKSKTKSTTFFLLRFSFTMLHILSTPMNFTFKMYP